MSTVVVGIGGVVARFSDDVTDPETLLICPSCGEKTLEQGERCDVGWGEKYGVQIAPDHCPECGYIESRDTQQNDIINQRETSMYIDQCTYKESSTPEHTYTFTGPCIVTKKPYSVTVKGKELFAFRQGAHVQDAFLSLNDDDREFLISGCSPEGWAQTFDGDED